MVYFQIGMLRSVVRDPTETPDSILRNSEVIISDVRLRPKVSPARQKLRDTFMYVKK